LIIRKERKNTWIALKHLRTLNELKVKSMRDIKKNYKNGDITIVWQPQLCIHSTICWKATGMPEVFNPHEKPWIKPENGTTEQLIAQVNKCPSGALSYYKNDEPIVASEIQSESIVEVAKNGPLLVYGNVEVKKQDGSKEHKHKVTAFCRCGASTNKPYCDGSHVKIGFRDE
jgi:uncharacterized Fe-S cluster protein YjdI